MPPPKPLTPNNIRSLRRSKSPVWRQLDLAQKIGVSQSDLGKYERGERTPSLSIALRICQVLSKPLEHVFWGLRDVSLLHVYRLADAKVEVDEEDRARPRGKPSDPDSIPALPPHLPNF